MHASRSVAPQIELLHQMFEFFSDDSSSTTSTTPTATTSTTTQTSTTSAQTTTTTTATASTSASDGGSWLSSVWGTVAKSTSAIVEIYKRDLNEFSTTIAHDTKETIQNIDADKVQQQLNKAIDNVASTVAAVPAAVLAGVAAIEGAATASDSGTTTTTTSSSSSASGSGDATSRRKKGAPSLDVERVYACDPKDARAYADWKAQFVLSDKTDEISSLLTDNEPLRTLHAKIGE